MRCYKCGKDLPPKAKTCPSCGQMVFTTASSPGAAFGRRLDGCLPETRSARDYTAVPNVSSLPPRADLRPGCSPIEDQGQLGSCTANAIVGAVEFKRRKEGKQDDLSRLFVYYNARRLDGRENEDCGAKIAHGMAAFMAHGAPPESVWPYDPSKVNAMPSGVAYDQGGANSEIEYARVDGLEHIKGALVRQQPVVFSISLPLRCFHEVGPDGRIPTPTDAELDAALTPNGMHAMLLVGYDDDQRIFHVRNSWGADWGDRGYCRLPMDLFQKAMAEHTAWILGSLETSGAFSVARPDATSTSIESKPVEGSVAGLGAKLRDDLRGSLGRDMDSALKSIRDRMNPPKREG